MIRRKLEYIMSAGRMRGKRCMGKPQETMPECLASWHAEISVLEIIGGTRDRRLWADMIINVT